MIRVHQHDTIPCAIPAKEMLAGHLRPWLAEAGLESKPID